MSLAPGLSPQVAGISAAKLQAVTGTKTTGANGDYVRGTVDLGLSNRTLLSREILALDLSDVSKRIGVQIDGFLG